MTSSVGKLELPVLAAARLLASTSNCEQHEHDAQQQKESNGRCGDESSCH
jgi:hypothetical protein